MVGHFMLQARQTGKFKYKAKRSRSISKADKRMSDSSLYRSHVIRIYCLEANLGTHENRYK